MRFELTTFCLGSKHSTTELRPLIFEAKIRKTRKTFDVRRLYSA